jgi:hypothetical protein
LNVLLDCKAVRYSFYLVKNFKFAPDSPEWDAAALLDLEMQASCHAGDENSVHWGA